MAWFLLGLQLSDMFASLSECDAYDMQWAYEKHARARRNAEKKSEYHKNFRILLLADPLKLESYHSHAREYRKHYYHEVVKKDPEKLAHQRQQDKDAWQKRKAKNEARRKAWGLS